MKRTIEATIFALALFPAACGSSNSTPPGPTTAAPSAASAALLTQTSGYQSWPKFDEDATPKLSGSHMSSYVVAFHNDVVTQAMTAKTLPLPDGAIIVKQNFMKATDTTPMALTIMSKQSGSWYWLEATPDGQVILDMTGKPLEGTDVQMCIMCHQQQASNDFVFTHDFTM